MASKDDDDFRAEVNTSLDRICCQVVSNCNDQDVKEKMHDEYDAIKQVAETGSDREATPNESDSQYEDVIDDDDIDAVDNIIERIGECKINEVPDDDDDDYEDVDDDIEETTEYDNTGQDLNAADKSKLNEAAEQVNMVTSKLMATDKSQSDPNPKVKEPEALKSPKKGYFYEHDNRDNEDADETLGRLDKETMRNRRNIDDKWQHDLFDPNDTHDRRRRPNRTNQANQVQAGKRQQQVNRLQNISKDHQDNSFEPKNTDKNQRFKHPAVGPSGFNRFKPSQEPNPPADTRSSSLKHVNNQSDDQQRRISYKAIHNNLQSQTQQTTSPVMRFTIKNDKYIGDAQPNEYNPSNTNTKPYENQIESQQHSQTHTHNVHGRLEHVNKFQDYELYNESTQQRVESTMVNVDRSGNQFNNHRASVHSRLGNQTRNEPSDTKANRLYTGSLHSRLVDQQPSVRDADYAEPNRQMRHRLGNNNTNWNYMNADDGPSTIDLKQTISFRNSNLKNHSKDIKKPEYSNNAERFDARGKSSRSYGSSQSQANNSHDDENVDRMHPLRNRLDRRT